MKVFKLEKVIAHMKNGVNVKQNKNGVGDRLSRIETISDGKFNFDKVGFAELSSDQKSKYKINKNDILFSHINSLEHLGKTAIYEGNQEIYHGVNLLLIRANDLVLPKYLRYFFIFLRNSGYWIINGKQAINQASVNQADIKNLQIPVPSLQEQEEIVERLDKIFSTLEAKRKTNAFLIIKLKHLFYSKINKDFHGQKNIEKIVNFTDSVEVINKDAVKKRDYLKSGKYPIVAQEKFLINGYTNNNKNLIKSPIPLIGFGDHTKVVKFLNFPFVKGADGLKVLKVNQDILPKYFYWWLKSLNLRNLGYARHYKLLKKYKIEVIPLKNQKEVIKNIDELAKNIAKIIENYQKLNINLDLLKKSVLKKEFSYE